MRALIVHAHPEPTSFNTALRDAAVRAVAAAGHEVEVSDLYAQDFEARAGRNDFLSAADPARFHYQREQEHAARTRSFAADLEREQASVAAADLLILQFPLWWGGPPAILKGWFERVMAYGFAYVDARRFESGLFKGRRALISVTTGGTRDRFAPGGVYGDIDAVLYPVRRLMLEYMGYEVAPPFVSYAAPRIDDAERQALLAQWAATVAAALAAPLPARPADEDALAAVGAAAWTRPV